MFILATLVGWPIMGVFNTLTFLPPQILENISNLGNTHNLWRMSEYIYL